MLCQISAIDNSAVVNASPEIFDQPFKEGLVHQSVVSYLANSRNWSAVKKNRSRRKGSNAKPWNQKGGGRARAGNKRSPIWIGGGKTFAPEYINYSQKVNKKVYRLSMIALFSELLRNDKLKVFSGFEIPDFKTKSFLKKIASWGLEVDRFLMVFDEITQEIYFSSRNLPNLDVVNSSMLNPYMLLSYDLVLIKSSEINKIEEQFK